MRVFRMHGLMEIQLVKSVQI